jgi:hypothetical protein
MQSLGRIVISVFRVVQCTGFCPDCLFCRRGAHYKQEQCVSLFPRPGAHPLLALKISRKKLVRVYTSHGLLKKIVGRNVRIKYQSYIFFSPLSTLCTNAHYATLNTVNSFYDFDIWFWNYSISVVFLVLFFHFISTVIMEKTNISRIHF